MTRARDRALLAFLSGASPLLLIAVGGTFGALAPRFLEPENLVNIVVQSSSTALVAIGMTFVLLTAGVDLSVGASMFVGAAIAGKLLVAGYPAALALIVMLAVGVALGALNALFVVRLRIIAFVVTLATLYAGRGLALWITRTRSMNLPEAILDLGAVRLVDLGVAITPPFALLVAVAVAAQLVLTRTPYGRQLYAVGSDPDAARKAGIRVDRILASVYVVSGACAALGGIVSLTQLGSVRPTFGEGKEFAAIAAAVLGGTSLFGGRGSVLPGTVLGAVLIQTVENGLVIVRADPYLYPLITSAIIFIAVLIDSLRHGVVERLSRRKIRPEAQ